MNIMILTYQTSFLYIEKLDLLFCAEYTD